MTSILERNIWLKFEYANYAHIFLYLAYDIFEEKMRQDRQIGRINYDFQAEVDGNVVHFKLITQDESILDDFQVVLTNIHSIPNKKIRLAISKVAMALERKSHIKDLSILAEGLNSPEIFSYAVKYTDDSLTSPAVDFGKKYEPRKISIDFTINTHHPMAKAVCDYYIPAMAQQISHIVPTSIVETINNTQEISIATSRDVNLETESLIDDAIDNLKILSFDKQLAKLLKINNQEITNILRKISISSSSQDDYK